MPQGQGTVLKLSGKLGVVVSCCRIEGCQWWRREIVLASVVSPVITGHDVFGAVDKHPVSAIGLISREESMGEVITLISASFPICSKCRRWL